MAVAVVVVAQLKEQPRLQAQGVLRPHSQGEGQGVRLEDQSDRIIDDDVLARLLSFNNVIVTSHQAFFTHEAMENIAATTLQNIKDFINHKPSLNVV